MTKINEEPAKKSRTSKYYVAKTKVPATSTNPWAQELARTIKKGNRMVGFSTTRQEVFDQTTGEVKTNETAIIGVRRIIDKEEFVKIFAIHVLEQMAQTSKTVKDVFFVFLNAYKDQDTSGAHPDRIYMSHGLARDEWGFKKQASSWKSGVNALCNEGIIAPVKNMEGFYWINPNVFFKGDRLRIVNEFAVSGTEAAEQQEAENARLQQAQLPLGD